MVISGPFLRAAHTTAVHPGDSIGDSVAGVRAADIQAMLITRDAAPALAATPAVLPLDRRLPAHGDA